MQNPLGKSSFEKILLLLGTGVILVFAAAVFAGMYLVRTEVREKMLQRDAALLQRVALYLYDSPSSTNLRDWDIVDLALDSSEIDGIIAVRVFRPLQTLIQQVPETLYPVSLSEADRRQLESQAPVIRYFEDYPIDALFFNDGAIRSLPGEPLLEIVIPLPGLENQPAAAIQYWIDGSSIKTEFAQLDRHLLLWGTAFIAGGTGIFWIIFFIARKRLAQMAQLLAQRNEALKRANRDLALAAKTSAIGAVASHLFHGLKNPLAGLKTYLQLTRGDAEAMDVANRMQGLIDETLSVIREEESDYTGELTFDEAVQLIRNKLNPNANKHISVSLQGTGQISHRSFMLLQLILRNLVDNALQAKPVDNRVLINLQSSPQTCTVTVSDSGPGLPEHIRKHLFEPVSSAKANGSGIGLAISAVLARHLPGTLQLKETGPNGTSFVIVIHL